MIAVPGSAIQRIYLTCMQGDSDELHDHCHMALCRPHQVM